MTTNKIPENLHPYYLNKIVTLQVFDRVTWNSDEVDTDSLIKIVGTLEEYGIVPAKNTVLFRFKGEVAVTRYDLEYKHVEVFPYDGKAPHVY